MAYTATADLIIAAGGEPALLELTDYDGDDVPDATVLAFAQAEADEMINSAMRRLYGDQLPFATVSDSIRVLAATETVYRLRVYRRVQTANDDALHVQRAATLEAIAAGKNMPLPSDTYPIGEGGGTPVVVERSTETSEDAGFVTRDSLSGFR